MLYCDDFLGEDVCFRHSGTSPVEFIRFTSCLNPLQTCVMGDNYAWVDASKQFYSSGSKTEHSQVYMKTITGHCKHLDDFRRDLLPGRNCTYDSQCLSGLCNQVGVCSGKAVNEPCSHNSECDIGLACIQQTRTFPWQTICKRFLFEGDECDNDYQCGFDMICSSVNALKAFNNEKQCTSKYSLRDGVATGYQIFENDLYKDTILNGRKCQSGLCRRTTATECRCFSIANITSDYGLQLRNSSLQCTAMSQHSYCQYFYEHDDDGDRVNNLGLMNLPCQCSLDGSVGYCPLPHQEQVTTYVNTMRQVDSYSSGCHTLDRYSIQAQMECGIGRQYVNIQDMRSILEIIFKFNYFPFTQYQHARSIIHPCLNQGHPESPESLIRLTQLLRDKYSVISK